MGELPLMKTGLHSPECAVCPSGHYIWVNAGMVIAKYRPQRELFRRRRKLF
jgi:hypothetical protein